MTFSPTFTRPFAATFDRRVAVAAVANWWDSLTDIVAVYQAKFAASLAASYVNLVNPGTYDAAPGVAPGWGVLTGWGFNGVSQYLTTGIVPQSGWSALLLFSDAVYSGDRYAFGSWDTGSTARFAPLFRASTGRLGWTYANGVAFGASGPTAGVFAAAGNVSYLNGASFVTTAGTFNNANAAAIMLGCRPSGATPQLYLQVNIQAFAICSSTQTAQQIATASAALAAL